MNATIGQYADFISVSDIFEITCYGCGQPVSHYATKEDGTSHALCNGCHFRHTVMKAAGREDEFWAAAGKHESHDIVSNVAREMTYRMAQSVDAIVRATADEL